MHLGDDRNRGLDEGNDDNGDDDKYDDDDNNNEGGDDDTKHDNDGDDVKVCDWVCSLAAWGEEGLIPSIPVVPPSYSRNHHQPQTFPGKQEDEDERDEDVDDTEDAHPFYSSDHNY